MLKMKRKNAPIHPLHLLRYLIITFNESIWSNVRRKHLYPGINNSIKASTPGTCLSIFKSPNFEQQYLNKAPRSI